MKGPLSAMSKTRSPIPAGARPPADRLEALELSEQVEKKAPEKKPLGKVADKLNQGVYVYDWTHASLYVDIGQGRKAQLAVTEFYPGLSLAVDKFNSMERYNEAHCDLKKKALNASGIKYIVLHPNNSLSSIDAQLEDQNL